MLKIPPRAGLATLLVAAFLPVGAPAPACAGEGPRAVLVIDTGADEYRYCVALGEEEVSGIAVIKLAGAQHGLDYSLGYGGGAVCRLAGVGPDGDDCWAEYPHFWAYWRGDGSGGWAWSSTGAGSTTVVDGDVEGWSWGEGDDSSSHPPPPETAHGDVCPEVSPAAGDEPRPRAKKRASRDGPAEAIEPSPASPGTAAADDGAAEDKRRRRPSRSGHTRRDRRDAPLPSPSPLPSPFPARDVDAAAGPRAGPPAAGLVALGLAGALVVLGAVVRRRRPAGTQ